MVALYRVRTALTGGAGGNELGTMFFDGTTGTPQDAADAVRAFWYDCRDIIHTSYTCAVEPEVYTIDSTTGEATGVTSTSTLTVAGLESGGLLPNATQGLARWHSGSFVGGREIQGKSFIPGTTTSYNTGGLPTASYKSKLQTAMTNLTSAGPITFGIYSRKHHLFVQATGGSPWNQWAVLRSRRT